MKYENVSDFGNIFATHHGIIAYLFNCNNNRNVLLYVKINQKFYNEISDIRAGDTVQDDEFLQDFVDEAKGHIEEVESAFLDTEKFKDSYNQGSYSQGSDDQINNVFRAVHSIKGTAGFFQLKNIVTLAHAMENVLGQIRSKSLTMSENILDWLLLCNDCLKQMVYNVTESDKLDISPYLNKLDDILSPKALTETTQAKPTGATPPQENPPDTKTAPAKKPTKQKDHKSPESKTSSNAKPDVKPLKLTTVAKPQPIKNLHVYGKKVSLNASVASEQINEAFCDALTALAAKGHTVYKVVIPYDAELRDHCEPAELFGRFSAQGEIVDAFADISDSHDVNDITDVLTGYYGGDVRLELLVTNVLTLEKFCDETGVEQSWVKEIKPEVFTKKRHDEEVHDEPAQSAIKPEETIRVSVKLLENLMALSGEMVLARNQLLNAYENRNTDASAMTHVLQNIDNLTSQLQEEVMQTRMQPLGNVFNKFPRVVREIAKSINKEIALNIQGKDIELDRSMIEGLVDPLTHLVRNSADHGLEYPDVRERAGKSRKGTITLRAYHKSGLVAVDVSDDGSGIDIAAVKTKAIEKGLLPEDQAAVMSDNDAFKLIMLPGFSTAKIVSDLSGRGVGMDVVKNNVEKLGGTVEISSAPGAGTTITLLLPRTLAIMHSLMVGTCGQRFAMPQMCIDHVVSLKSNELGTKLEHIKNSKEIRLRGKLLPIISLAEVLGLKPGSETKVVVINVFKRQFGLLVGEVFDTEETLVKPLPSCLKSCIVYSGVTIMGDGKISLILDPEGIAKRSQAHFPVTEQESAPDRAEREKIMLEYQNMMMFKCSGTETYAIDMNMVSRVETILASDIEEVGGDSYAKIRGKAIRVIRPEDFLPLKKKQYEKEKLTVIVPNLVSHPIGLLVERIIDNAKEHFDLDTEQIKAKGIFGTVLYQNRLVVILNLYELFELVEPATSAADKDINMSKRVLIVEDTPFFQHVEAKYLEAAGCTVSVAENGKEALELLRRNTYDAVVSDLIMPIMGGLELIQNIRKDTRLRNIPAVAVSSMTASNYVNQAIEYGFDAFENKLNKETLIKTVDNVIKSRRGVSGR